MIKRLKELIQRKKRLLFFLTFLLIITGFFIGLTSIWQKKEQSISRLETEREDLKTQLLTIGNELDDLKNEDQFVRNEKLEEEINNIQTTYQQAVNVFENLLSLKEQTTKTSKQDSQFAESLTLLSKRNYASASVILKNLNQEINQEKEALVAKFEIPTTVPESNTPPGSGYSRQSVSTGVGAFMVSVVAADLNSTRVIVDTASDGDCHNDCPTLPLATYVSRSGAFAGINGAYFCPAEYPSCANKKNSFDTLLMNKNKVYFNSDNNVYSSVPAVIFQGNSARFVTQSLEWGRDTGVDAVIANHPLLTFNAQVFFTGTGDAKQGVKSGRSFVGTTGNTVYIGVVHNATVAESAQVVHAMGIHNALNLDSGGSTALWFGGYKVGPGRNLANGLLLVKK